MGVLWCEVCSIRIDNSTSMRIQREKHEGSAQHKQMVAIPEEFQKCFQCGANIKREASGHTSLPDHMKRCPGLVKFVGEHQLSEAYYKMLASPISKAEYEECDFSDGLLLCSNARMPPSSFRILALFHSWRQPGSEKPKAAVQKRYSREELSQMPHEELVDAYWRLQEEGIERGSKERRSVGLATFKAYYQADEVNLLARLYAGHSDALAVHDRHDVHKRDADKVGRMSGTSGAASNRVEVVVASGLTWEQATTVEHCLQSQQARSHSPNKIMATQRLPLRELRDGTWAMVSTQEYTRVVLTLAIYQLRLHFPDHPELFPRTARKRFFEEGTSQLQRFYEEEEPPTKGARRD